MRCAPCPTRGGWRPSTGRGAALVPRPQPAGRPGPGLRRRGKARARYLEASLPGAALVGDNLAAALDGARSDALYDQVLFILAATLAAVVAGAELTVRAAGRGRIEALRDL